MSCGQAVARKGAKGNEPAVSLALEAALQAMSICTADGIVVWAAGLLPPERRSARRLLRSSSSAMVSSGLLSLTFAGFSMGKAAVPIGTLASVLSPPMASGDSCNGDGQGSVLLAEDAKSLRIAASRSARASPMPFPGHSSPGGGPIEAAVPCTPIAPTRPTAKECCSRSLCHWWAPTAPD